MHCSLAAVWRAAPNSEAKLQAGAIGAELLQGESAAAAPEAEPEGAFRAVVALGTLTHQDEQTRALLRDLELRPALAKLTAPAPAKLVAAAAQLAALL